MEIPWFDINNSKSLFSKITISDAVATSDLAISDTAFYRHKFASLSTTEEANFPECLTHFFLKAASTSDLVSWRFILCCHYIGSFFWSVP